MKELNREITNNDEVKDKEKLLPSKMTVNFILQYSAQLKCEKTVAGEVIEINLN